MERRSHKNLGRFILAFKIKVLIIYIYSIIQSWYIIKCNSMNMKGGNLFA